jgi:acyl-CoA synthetase (AMP-forming)/AMP-acid ligase II
MIEPPLLERISDYVSWYAARTPDAEAMVLDGVRTSYRELAIRVDAMSCALRAAGVAHGDRVAMFATPHPDFFVAFLATASLGAIWVGLNPRYREEELAYVLHDSEPTIVLAQCRSGERDHLPELLALRTAFPKVAHWVALTEVSESSGFIALNAFLRQGATLDPNELQLAREKVRTHDPALIVYTSGSTGQPKGALLSHHGLTRCSLVQFGEWRVRPLRTLNFFPINHIGSVGDISCYSLVAGGCIVFLEKFSPAQVLELIAAEGITFWAGVPTTFLLTLADSAFASADLSSVQIIMWSGAAASAELVAQLASIGARLTTSYGLTETVGSVTYAAFDASQEVLSKTIGAPSREYEVRLVDTTGCSVADNVPGEIQVRGDFIMRGYWRRPEATAEAIDEQGWLHTGDLAIRDPEGQLRIVGRLKEIFKSGGYNIYPREIEQVLERYPGVSLASVVAVPDPIFGEVGHAFVVPGAATLQESTLLDHCRRLLANYKVPKRITLLAELPMLPIGKVDKRRLRELASSSLPQ